MTIQKDLLGSYYNPLQGLEKIPGLGGYDANSVNQFATTQGIYGGLQQLLPSLAQGENLALALGKTGLGYTQNKQKAFGDLAGYALQKQGAFKTGLEIGEKQFDLGLKQRNDNNLMKFLYSLPKSQQQLALASPEKFMETMLAQYNPTADQKEYNFAVTQGYKGDLEDWIKDVTKFKATTINMGQEGAYNKKLGDLLAEQDVALIQSAKDVPYQLAKIDQTLAVVRDPNTNTGKFADFETNFKAASQTFLGFGSQVDTSVESTQILDALLGSEVFPMIKSLGIGARGLDTPAERKFLQKVMTGEITMNRATITKLTMIRRRQIAKIAEQYNAALERGDLDQYTKGSNRQLQPLDIGTGTRTRRIGLGRVKDSNERVAVYADGSAYYTDENGQPLLDEKGKLRQVPDYNYLTNSSFE